MPPHRRYPQVPWLAQTSTPNLTFFCEPLLLIVSRREMAIKHSNYIQTVPFLCTERACVVFLRFQNSSRKIFCGNGSVVSIKDQREYILLSGLLLGDDKTQQPPFLHSKLALKSPKQQPTPRSCLSSHSLDMLLKSSPWDAYKRQEWWLLH